MVPFAPKTGYAGDGTPQGAISEFKTMVRELHAARIEVILDIVLNHTAEGGEDGPTCSWRGLDNRIYDLLAADGSYLDFTGCRNTLNCGHPVVQDYILDDLRHWAVDTHVDGFRLDLAAVLARLPSGEMTADAPLLDRTAEDPVLRGLELIAEPWDVTGPNIGRGFAMRGCAEWNDCFRDDVRRSWRGDPGVIGRFAARICGSANLYERLFKTPLRGINFVTAHDGFTLRDLVSYRHKRNEANDAGGRRTRHARGLHPCTLGARTRGADCRRDDFPDRSHRQRRAGFACRVLLISREGARAADRPCRSASRGRAASTCR